MKNVCRKVQFEKNSASRKTAEYFGKSAVF